MTVLFDSFCPSQQFSAMPGRVFMGRTSSNLFEDTTLAQGLSRAMGLKLATFQSPVYHSTGFTVI